MDNYDWANIGITILLLLIGITLGYIFKPSNTEVHYIYTPYPVTQDCPVYRES